MGLSDATIESKGEEIFRKVLTVADANSATDATAPYGAAVTGLPAGEHVAESDQRGHLGRGPGVDGDQRQRNPGDSVDDLLAACPRGLLT